MLTVGVVVGLIAGYFRGWVDTVISVFINIFYGIPGILVAIVLYLVLGRGLGNIMLAISATVWMDMARLVRGQAFSIREREFIEAARASGARSGKILFGHILPNSLGPIIVQATFVIPIAILTEAFLSYLGLGIPITAGILGIHRLRGVCCPPLGAIHDALARHCALRHAARLQLPRRRPARRLRSAPTAVTDPILDVRNLSTHFFTDDGEVKAVRGVSFHVQPGETAGHRRRIRLRQERHRDVGPRARAAARARSSTARSCSRDATSSS